MNGRKIIWIVVAILFICLVVRLVMPSRKPAVVEPPPKPFDATDYTQRLADERMEDKEYMAGLKGYQGRQSELAVRRSALVGEYMAWKKGFVVSNDEARALIEAEVASATNSAAAAALNEKIEAIIAKDPAGADFIARRDAIDADIQSLQGEIKAYIGDRIRRQVAEHGGEEAAAARKYAATHEGSMPLPTNAAPRRVGGASGAGAADNR